MGIAVVSASGVSADGGSPLAYESYPVFPAVDPVCSVTSTLTISPECIPRSFRAEGSSHWGANVIDAWTRSVTGDSVVVAVLDGGSLAHPDITANLLPGYDFVSGSATANDGNGRDSDPTDAGLPTSSTSTAVWHGLHVMGTIGAVDNTIGLKGVSPGAKILPVRVLGNAGGDSGDVIAGIRWAANVGPDPTYGWFGTAPSPAVNPNPAQIINLSLGGTGGGIGGSCDASTQQAVDDAIAAGVVVVAAAGNDDANAETFSPANCDGVIAVGATNGSGTKASFSNWGPTVDLSAPGTSILSLYNTGTKAAGSSSYASLDGTSMASPHVAGVAALMLEANPLLTPAEVEQMLEDSASAFASTPTCGVAPCLGAGIVDADAAVMMAAEAYVDYVAPPTQVTAALTGSSITVTWQSGFAELVAFQASPTSTYVVKNGPTTLCTVNAVETPYTCSATGLTVGTTYTYTVEASTGSIESTAIAANAVKYVVAPGMAGSVAVSRSDRSVTVTWTAATSTGGNAITAYFAKPSTGTTVMKPGTSRSHTFTSLQRGRAYRFSVTPHNGTYFGPEKWSSWVRIPVLRRSSTLFSVIIPPPAGSTNRLYTTSGRCTKSGSYAKASAYTGTCKVTLRYVQASVTMYAYAYVPVV